MNPQPQCNDFVLTYVTWSVYGDDRALYSVESRSVVLHQLVYLGRGMASAVVDHWRTPILSSVQPERQHEVQCR